MMIIAAVIICGAFRRKFMDLEVYAANRYRLISNVELEFILVYERLFFYAFHAS
jgi:hypothetical protein